MSSARAIKNRIKSTKNIAQITKAMEAVSAVKMRRSQEVALSSRPYSFAALRILSNLTGRKSLAEGYESPLINEREIKKICLVVVTSDKGLCGAFNSNVLREASNFIKEQSVDVDIYAIGKKAKNFALKNKHNVCSEFLGIGDYASTSQTNPMAHKLQELFINGDYDAIYSVYTNFISVLNQKVVLEKLLPFSKEEISKRVLDILPESGKYFDLEQDDQQLTTAKDYLFEPSPKDVLDALLPLLFETEVYHMILEANASEHSARMVAMKSASENASELIDDLTLSYNKARQAQITKELTEITAGAAAQSSDD